MTKTGFLQCFDTVGLVIWPVNIIPEMTYNVLSGTINTTLHSHIVSTPFASVLAAIYIHICPNARLAGTLKIES